MKEITLTKPDDWHLHLRDGEAMADALAHTARVFSRAIVMPNLRPPITTTKAALAYRERILKALPRELEFQPLMTLYLTDSTTPEEIVNARRSGHVYAVKYYPAGATTNSENGVTQVENVYPVLEAMAAEGVPLLVHGEVTHDSVDLFDREQVFIDTILRPLTERFPELKIVFEHITTAQAVDFVQQAGDRIAATITAHHLLYNRNHMLVGGIRPHLYCLPILKRNTHQEALIAAATSGSPKFFLGTDSAPHDRDLKENACGCAGCYTAHAAIELYAEVFDEAGRLDLLEGFASFFGPDFYGLPRNPTKITLKKESWTVPAEYPFGDNAVVPLRANQEIQWRVSGETIDVRS